MKRIVILSMLLVMGLFATAQTVVLMSAAEACNRGYLDKARKLIDVACNNEETKNDAKTWYYAGLIYSKIGNDPQKSASAPDWCVVASNAIQKCIQLDKEGEYKKECKQINNDIKKYCGQNISSSNTPEIKSDPSTINKDENANSIQSEVSLVVSADGKSKTEAVNNALRSAIEQTFGTFVSANTEILNDQLVKEEIATVSSGNIQKYTEVTTITLPNGNVSVTLNVTVSLSKLVSYAQSKGSECEFAGATFGANMRLYQFYKKNEQIAIENMTKHLNAMRPIFDYTITISDPIINDKFLEIWDENVKKEDYATIRISVTCSKTNKSELFKQILLNTLRSLGKPKEEISGLIQTGFQFVECIVDSTSLFFYNDIPDLLYGLLYNIKYDFAITDNNNSEYIFNFPTELIKRTSITRRDGGWGISVSTIEWMKDYCIWKEIPFMIPINDLQKITKISIKSTVADRTNYIYLNKSGYMTFALINGDQLITRYGDNYCPLTCYRTSETPRCNSESILNNPSELLSIIDKRPLCELARRIGIYHDNNIKY